MKYFLIFLMSLTLLSCEDPVEETPQEGTQEAQELGDLEERAKKDAMTKLNIPENEKFDFKIYHQEINSDTIKDAIITINRMQYAMDEAIRTGRQAKMAEIGFMGSYNFFIYYDGATKQFSVPIPIPSTPGRPLDVSFENILSKTRKDVVIDYRIRNSGWRAYFTVFNESDLTLVFRWKRFDFIGDENPEALLHRLVPAKDGIGTDIYIYESEIDNYSSNVGDIYQYVPSITKAGKLIQRFTFDSNYGKYKLIEE